MFYYTYVLLSEKDGKLYTGYSNDLKGRFEEHCRGKVSSTKIGVLSDWCIMRHVWIAKTLSIVNDT